MRAIFTTLVFECEGGEDEAMNVEQDGKAYVIRLAIPSDTAYLPDVERKALALFEDRASELGVEPRVNSVATFQAAQESDRLWVAGGADNKPIGFAIMTEIDGLAHLEEIDVVPEMGRKGVGSALLDAVCRWAKAHGYPAMTLSTFRDVPWNAPFYARMGFRALDASEHSPGLARLVDHESKLGLRTDRRVVMRRDL